MTAAGTPLAPDPAAIRDAASVLVIDRTAPSGPSVLMGMRGAGAAFMPSKYVFPGGAVDPADALIECGAPDSSCLSRLDAHLRAGGAVRGRAIAAAALRELAEETGLMIGQPGRTAGNWPEYERAGLVPDPSALIYVFRAITPPGRSRRFDARFFMIDAEKLHGDRHDFSLASDELSHLHWVALAVLPGGGARAGCDLADRLRGVVSDRPVRLPDCAGGGTLAVTVSAGIAIDDEGLCASATGIELLLSRADTAMRQAKRSGRDRSVRHGQPVAA